MFSNYTFMPVSYILKLTHKVSAGLKGERLINMKSVLIPATYLKCRKVLVCQLIYSMK